jgi:uncharacterized protein (UPF0276 family)
MKKKNLGFGLGLRTDHYSYILEHKPKVDWFEIISENYMDIGGKPKHYLHKIRENYPMVMHGVSLSIGSYDELDKSYLRQLKTLIDEVQPEWVSDHLCFTGNAHFNSHDLLPLPYNETTIKHLVDKIKQVQDYLGRQILIENVSSYMTYEASEMTEWEFIGEVARRSDCKLLFDINNIFVSSRNHNFDPHEYIQAIDPEKVWQFHLAGHSDNGSYIVDTHDEPVRKEVWDLYRASLEHFGETSTMIERDDKIPPFEEVLAELNFARDISNQLKNSKLEKSK